MVKQSGFGYQLSFVMFEVNAMPPLSMINKLFKKSKFKIFPPLANNCGKVKINNTQSIKKRNWLREAYYLKLEF